MKKSYMDRNNNDSTNMKLLLSNYYSLVKENNYNEKMNAELNDSSVLKIPNFLKIFTNGIEYHNVHHVNPGVPCYNIQRCYEELIEKNLLKNKEVGFSEMVESLGYTIYDIELDKYK
jgi:fatty acid desaturase